MSDVSDQVIFDTADGDVIIVEVNMGPPGPRGIPGPNLNARGQWHDDERYFNYDEVMFEGSTYWVFDDHDGEGAFGITPEDTSWWTVLAYKGEIGTTGPTGFEVFVSDPSPNAFTLDQLHLGDRAAVLRIPSSFNGFKIDSVAGAVTNPSTSGPVVVELVNARTAQTILSLPIMIEEGVFDTDHSNPRPEVDPDQSHTIHGDQILINVTSTGVGARGLIVEIVLTSFVI